MTMLPQVREIIASGAAPRAQILAALAELERAETAAIAQIDAVQARRGRSLIDAPDDVIDALDRELAAATRRLDRIEAQQAALYERLDGPLLAGDPL